MMSFGGSGAEMKSKKALRKKKLSGKMCKLYDKYCYVNHFWCDEVNAGDCYIRKAYAQGKKDAKSGEIWTAWHVKILRERVKDAKSEAYEEVLKMIKGFKGDFEIEMKEKPRRGITQYYIHVPYDMVFWLEQRIKELKEASE
jgi:hypothetical protein